MAANSPLNPAELRRRAEARAGSLAAREPESLSPEQARQALHELRVHQIELEMQNEELRRAQEELDASRARYFDLYDLAPVGYCTLTELGLILEANLTAATLLGAARSALVKQAITRFILLEDQDIYYRHRKQLFETGKPQTCELRMVGTDGRQFWAHLQATAVQDENGVPACRILLSDSTERKQAEAALHESEELYRLLAENAADVIWVLDVENDTFRYMSPSVERLRGYTAEEVMREGLVPELTSTALQHVRSVVPGQFERFPKRLTEVFTAELEQKHKDGHALWTEVRARCVVNKVTGRIEAIGVTRDITERKRAEEALQEKVVELRRALDQIKTLRGIVPICSGCKKIRDDQGFWQQVEVYVHDHTEAEFSHGLCPECLKKLYPAQATRLGRREEPR